MRVAMTHPATSYGRGASLSLEGPSYGQPPLTLGHKPAGKINEYPTYRTNVGEHSLAIYATGRYVLTTTGELRRKRPL